MRTPYATNRARLSSSIFRLKQAANLSVSTVAVGSSHFRRLMMLLAASQKENYCTPLVIESIHQTITSFSLSLPSSLYIYIYLSYFVRFKNISDNDIYYGLESTCTTRFQSFFDYSYETNCN
jgi:hypothetical protein